VYAILAHDSEIIFRTCQRRFKFASIHTLYDFSVVFFKELDFKKKHFSELYIEQKKDGVIDALEDFKKWYETRKSRAKVHLRMVAKLLYWHKLSVQKLWLQSFYSGINFQYRNYLTLNQIGK
jgi:hypothetical protein